MIFVGILLLSFIGGGAAQCLCNPDTSIPASVSAYVVTSPTSDGTLGGTPCAATCNTTVTITGLYNGGLPGAILKIQVADNLGTGIGNTVGIYNGDAKIDTLPSKGVPFTDYALQSNVVTFQFILATTAKVVIVMNPTSQQAATTTTAPPPTTPQFTHFPYNPAINVVDMVFAFDGSTDNTFLNQSFAIATNIASYYNFGGTAGSFGRLSVFTFDPDNVFGYGAAIPWTTTNDKLAAVFAGIFPYASGASQVYEGLKDAFGFLNRGKFPFRANAQRVLVYFTNQDSSTPANDVMAQIKTNIDATDLKVVVFNMDSNKDTSGSDFDLLRKLTNPGSNMLNFYTNTNKNEADLFISGVLQNGKALCNIPVSTSPLPTSGTIDPFNVPITNGHVYCNYIDVVQKYDANVSPSSSLQIAIPQPNINFNQDIITVYADDVPVSTFSGYAFNSYICLNATKYYGLGFKSAGGNVYSGFTTLIKLYGSYKDCVNTPPPPPPTIAFLDQAASEYRLIEV